MPKHQLLMGCSIAIFSAVGFWKCAWLLSETRKGAWLRQRWGEKRALWILRGLFSLGVVFGLMLAANLIRPIQW